MRNWSMIKRFLFVLFMLNQIVSMVYVFSISCASCWSLLDIMIGLMVSISFGSVTGTIIYFGWFSDKYSIIKKMEKE